MWLGLLVGFGVQTALSASTFAARSGWFHHSVVAWDCTRASSDECQSRCAVCQPGLDAKDYRECLLALGRECSVGLIRREWLPFREGHVPTLSFPGVITFPALSPNCVSYMRPDEEGNEPADNAQGFVWFSQESSSAEAEGPLMLGWNATEEVNAGCLESQWRNHRATARPASCVVATATGVVWNPTEHIGLNQYAVVTRPPTTLQRYSGNMFTYAVQRDCKLPDDISKYFLMRTVRTITPGVDTINRFEMDETFFF